MKKLTDQEFITSIEKKQSNGDYEGAINEAQKMLATNPKDTKICFAIASVLINSGGILNDIKSVENGLLILHKLLEDSDFSSSEEAVLICKYNISNAYYKRYKLLKEQQKLEEAIVELKKARDFIQDVLLNQNKLNFHLRSLAMSNYGNILGSLSRSIEAIDWYYDSIKINPNQAVAMANCGIAIKYLINLSAEHISKNAHEAWSLLTRACEMENYLELYAGREGYNFFKKELEDLLSVFDKYVIGGLSTILTHESHRTYEHATPEAEKWLETISSDRLLLTINQNPLTSESECVDDLFFNQLVTPSGARGEKRFTDLAHSLNILKEDFSTARYLFYHSTNDMEQIQKYSKITKFADTLDYSSFSIKSGMQKATFRIAADCLDKVAILVNEYFELHETNEGLNINNIWCVNKERKKGFHPIILEKLKENRFLQGLKNLQEDWFLESFPGPLKGMRNTATHLKFVIYEMRVSGSSSENNNWASEKDFVQYTHYLLRIVKAAIFYIVCAINFEESKKDMDNQLRGALSFNLK